jgi:two-component system CheB/CheR fusion protein
MLLTVRSPLFRFGFVCLAVAAAMLLRFLLWPILGPEIPFLFLWPAVLAAAWYGGLWPGLLATLLAALAEDYMLLGPGSIGTATSKEAAGLVLFVLLGASLSLLIDRLQRSRRQIDQHREWLRTTLNSIGDAVIATDPQRRVKFLNPVAQSLTGWKQDEATGQPLEQVFHIVHEQTRQWAENPVQRVLRTGDTSELTTQTVLLARNATESLIDGSAAPIRDNRGVVLVFRDVTKKRQMERQLQRRAKQLAQADRRKDEFLAMLGHELRNPLAPLKNATVLLRLKGTPDAEVQVIDRQVGQLARLVDDLLDVARINRGKIKLQKETIELAAVVERAIEISRPLIAARRHELIEALPREPIYLEADPVRLAQVLANLLNNAAKYTEPGGRIRLRAERQGQQVVLRVRDNGVGIAPKMLPRVFDLFAQADRTLDRSQGGLGIGLTLVKRLVELHGGRVRAVSRGLGKGSEFVVRLPVLGTPPPPGPAASVKPVRAGSRILVVDDNADAAGTLALLLQVKGHEVSTAHDGPTALELARAYHPGVVFLDIGLPGMDGYEVARRLRGQPDCPPCLLIALTGYGRDEDRRRGAEAGFDHYLVKPVDPEELQMLLARRQPSPP